MSIVGYDVLPVTFSDHCIISGSFDLGEGVDFGKGVWKMNCLMLEDEEVCEKLKIFYKSLVCQKYKFENI